MSRTKHLYIWLMMLCIATIGCGKSVVVPLEVTDIIENPIEADELEITADGEPINLELADSSGEKSVKVKVGKNLVVTANKTGFRSATHTEMVTEETARIPLRLEPFRPDLNLEMTLSPDRIVVGTDQTCNISMTLRNQGEGDAKNVVMTANIPEGLEYIADPESPQPEQVEGSLVWHLEELGAGDWYEAAYQLKPIDTARTGARLVQITASATDIIDDRTSDAERSGECYVTGQAELNAEYYPTRHYGDPNLLDLRPKEVRVQYVMEVKNSGGGSTKAINLFLSLPQGFTLDEVSVNPDVPVTAEGTGYSLELPPLSADGVHELTFDAIVSKRTLPGPQESRLKLITSDDTNRDIEIPMNTDVNVARIPQEAKLLVTKSLRQGPGKWTCELSIRNDGAGAAQRVEIIDTLPSKYSLILPIDLVESGQSEYELVQVGGESEKPETELTKGRITLSAAAYPPSLIWKLKRLDPGAAIGIKYEIRADADAPSLLTSTPPKVKVRANDEWDKQITAAASPKVRAATDTDPEAEKGVTGNETVRTGVGKRGGPPKVNNE